MTCLALTLLACVWISCTSADERRARTVELADELLARGDRAAAVAALESFLDYDPRDLAVTVRLAQLDLETSDAGDASGALRALARLESLPAGALAGGGTEDYFDTLVRARVYAGRIEQALPMLIARPETAQAHPELWQALIYRSAQLPQLVLPDLPARWRARRVDQLIQTGRLGPALDQWRLLPKVEEDEENREDTATRAQLLERILQASWARNELDHLRNSEGMAEEVTAEPPTPWKLLVRHRLLLDRHEEGEAAEVERRFLRRYPGHPQRFEVLMSLLRRENRRGHPDEALRLADEAVSLRPSDVGPMFEKALALRRLGRDDQARAQLELVLAQEPHHEAARLLLHRDDETRRAGRGGPRVESLELKLETHDG